MLRSLIICTVVALGGAPAARAATYLLPETGDVVGRVTGYTAAHEDTIVRIARKFGLGYHDLVAANPGVDPWLVGEGTEIVLPTRFVLPDAPRRGIVLNVPEMRLYYFPTPKNDEPAVVMTYPISVGRAAWKTPTGRTTVVRKDRQPSWYPPESIREEWAAEGRELGRVVPPGPDNPLGNYALRLGLPGYLIHGTNKPAGVGMRVTHGCIRMFPEDIEHLFGLVPTGLPVRIVNQPFKMGWAENTLFLEVHPPFEEDEHFAEKGLTSLTELVVRNTAEGSARVDWDAAERIFAEQRGIPRPMSVGAPMVARNVAGGGLDGWCAAGASIAACNRK